MSENSLAAPEHGARLLLRLRDEASASSVSYEVVLATRASSWEALAAVQALDGRVDLGTWRGSDTPPPWLLQAAHALLRAAWQRKRAGNAWPRRLSRWRPDPEASEP